MASLDGHHAIVTGGGRGIGRAIARALSGAGAAVTVVGRHEAALADAVAAGDAAGYVIADVTDERALREGDRARRRGARTDRHPGRQCGRGRERAIRQGRPRAVSPHVRAQPDGRGAREPRGAARHDRARLRPHRRGRLHGRAQGLRLRDRLLRRQARGGRPGARARARDRAHRRHRQRGLPRLHRHRPGAAEPRPHRAQDRPAARGSARRHDQGQPARPADPARGGRRRRAGAVRAGRRPPSPARPWRSRAARYDHGRARHHPARCGNQGGGTAARSPRRAAAVAAPAHLHRPDRRQRCAGGCARTST